MRHGGQVGGDDAAVDVLAHGQGELRLGLVRRSRDSTHVAQPDGFALVVRHLDADGALAGHALDEDALGAHGQAEIVGEAGDAAVLDAGFGLELEGGDHGAGIDLHDLAAHVELGAFFHQHAGFFAQFVFADDLWAGAGIEQSAGRQLKPLTFLGATVTVRFSASARSWMAMLPGDVAWAAGAGAGVATGVGSEWEQQREWEP